MIRMQNQRNIGALTKLLDGRKQTIYVVQVYKKPKTPMRIFRKMQLNLFVITLTYFITVNVSTLITTKDVIIDKTT